MERNLQKIKLLRNTAMISGIFALIICIMAIVNFIQLNKVDPLNTSTMNKLIDRLNKNPEDQALRDEIRELDLLARKAFFTNQWQVRTGGYLIFISVLVVIVSLKAAETLKNKLPEVPDVLKDSFWENRNINRKWVAIAGGAIVLLSLTFAFISQQQLGKTLNLVADKNNLSSNLKDINIPNKNDKNANINAKNDTTKKSDSDKDNSAIPDKAPTYDQIIKNFPSFRGVGGNGIAWQKNIPVSWDGKSGKNILWKTVIPLPGYNSPVIWDDKIFIAGANESKKEIYCFDLLTGKLLWTYTVSGIAGSGAAPKVSNDTGHSAASLSTDGRFVIAIFANGDIVAVDTEGKKVWGKNLGVPQNHYGHSSSLIINGDMVIVQYDQRTSPCVMALSVKTGDQIWKTSRNVKISWASPVLVYTGKRSELLLVAEPYVASYNPANGQELWKFDCISGEVGPSVAYSNGIVFSINEYSKLTAIQIGDQPKMLWEDTDFLSDIPSPVATDKYLFMSTSYGTVVCYDSQTGNKYWTQELGNSVFASPILVEGKIYLMDKKGIMHIFVADKTWKPVGSPALGEGSVATPAFADGKIVIRGDKNLYCIGK